MTKTLIITANKSYQYTLRFYILNHVICLHTLGTTTVIIICLSD